MELLPFLFVRNDLTAPATRESAFERAKKRQFVLSQKASQAENATVDHDYVAHPPAGKHQIKILCCIHLACKIISVKYNYCYNFIIMFT